MDMAERYLYQRFKWIHSKHTDFRKAIDTVPHIGTSSWSYGDNFGLLVAILTGLKATSLTATNVLFCMDWNRTEYRLPLVSHRDRYSVRRCSLCIKSTFLHSLTSPSAYCVQMTHRYTLECFLKQIVLSCKDTWTLLFNDVTLGKFR